MTYYTAWAEHMWWEWKVLLGLVIITEWITSKGESRAFLSPQKHRPWLVLLQDTTTLLLLFLQQHWIVSPLWEFWRNWVLPSRVGITSLFDEAGSSSKESFSSNRILFQSGTTLHLSCCCFFYTESFQSTAVKTVHTGCCLLPSGKMGGPKFTSAILTAFGPQLFWTLAPNHWAFWGELKLKNIWKTKGWEGHWCRWREAPVVVQSLPDRNRVILTPCNHPWLPHPWLPLAYLIPVCWCSNPCPIPSSS